MMIILLSSVLTFFLIKFFILTTKYTKLIDFPNFRKIHFQPVPLVGGLAIYFNLIFFVTFLEFDPQIEFIVIASSLLLFLGILDDLFNLSVVVRLFAQFFITLFVVIFSIRIVDLSDYFSIPFLDIEIVSIFLTVIAIMSLTNAINFIDGIDGLSSGIIFIVFFSLILASNFFLTSINYNILIILCSSLFIFWIFNLSLFGLNKIFLGDSGSTFLGFITSCFLIYYSQSHNKFIDSLLVIWFVALPIFDIFSITIRRVLNGSSPFKPDKKHIHHLLLENNLSTFNTLIILLFLSIFFIFFGFFTFVFINPIVSIFLYLISFIVYFIFTFQLSKKSLKQIK